MRGYIDEEHRQDTHASARISSTSSSAALAFGAIRQRIAPTGEWESPCQKHPVAPLPVPAYREYQRSRLRGDWRVSTCALHIRPAQARTHSACSHCPGQGPASTCTARPSTALGRPAAMYVDSRISTCSRNLVEIRPSKGPTHNMHELLERAQLRVRSCASARAPTRAGSGHSSPRSHCSRSDSSASP